MKRNALLDRMEKIKREAALNEHRFTRQLMCDLAFIALNKQGLGAKRLTQFANDLSALFDEYATIWNDDADKEYAMAKLDDKLKQIFGDDFYPWEVRYGK